MVLINCIWHVLLSRQVKNINMVYHLQVKNAFCLLNYEPCYHPLNFLVPPTLNALSRRISWFCWDVLMDLLFSQLSPSARLLLWIPYIWYWLAVIDKLKHRDCRQCSTSRPTRMISSHFFFIANSWVKCNPLFTFINYLHIQLGDEHLRDNVTNRQAKAETATQIETSKKTQKYEGSTWVESSMLPAITLLKNINASGQGTLFVPRNI